jgi:hypothetical protein
MTAQEKADELIAVYARRLMHLPKAQRIPLAKVMAIICVEEIMGLCPNPKNTLLDEDFDYWNEVLPILKNKP